MLKITIPQTGECYDESTNMFIPPSPEIILELEHSLVSVAKWESIWKKAFLSKSEKSMDETLSYIKCMTINDIDERAYLRLTASNMKTINDYIEDPMTATSFKEKGKSSNELVTAEIIYYNMVALNIPFECQYWHLNRLLTLIRVCDLKSSPKKKMPTSSILSQNAMLNAQRRAKLHSRG